MTMKAIVSGKNISVTPQLHEAALKKLAKLEKYFQEEVTAQVTLSVEKKERHKAEVTIPVKGTILRGETVTTDMYASIDMAVEVLEKQLLKYRHRITDRHQGKLRERAEGAVDENAEEEGISIVRNKKFDIKPMYPEDACVQMELLGHSFFVFTNAETDDVSVVYRRKDGTYGLIEPDR